MTVILLSSPIVWVSVFFCLGWRCCFCRTKQFFCSDWFTYRCAALYFFCMHKSQRPAKENTLHLEECMNKKNSMVHSAEHPCEARHRAYVHNSHTTAHRNQRNDSREADMFRRVPPSLPIWPSVVEDAKLEVAGTNNYNQRNYNAKRTAAPSTADKSLWAIGDSDRHQARERETGKRRRGGGSSTRELFL